MSDVDDELPPDATVAARLATYVRAGGVVTPLITLFIAFLIGGLVVLVTGHDPIATYKAIFNGTGLNWFFPWISDGGPHDRGAQPAADADRGRRR